LGESKSDNPDGWGGGKTSFSSNLANGTFKKGGEGGWKYPTVGESS